MSQKPNAQTVVQDLLETISGLTSVDSFVRVTDNLLSEFRFRQLMRECDNIPEFSKRWLVKAILQLNFNRDLEIADSYFQKAIKLSKGDSESWTHYPANLADRGFISTAYYYFGKAVEEAPCKSTLFNLYSASLDVRDGNTAKKAADLYKKLYYNDEAIDAWVESAMQFHEHVTKHTERLGYDGSLVTKVLLESQDFMASLGYKVPAVTHHLDDVRDEVFALYHIVDITTEEVGHLNERLADFIVDNDYLDAGVVIAVTSDKKE